MLTFLRKIRRSLLASGAVRKYLLYAIGEIALVVIGILIALQINNWNEWRKDRIMELSLLIELHEEFTTNKARLDSTVSRNREIIQKLTKLIALFPINSKTLDNETLKDCQSMLNVAGRIATLDPSNSIINAVTNNNSFELISDNALRKEVLNWHAVLEDYVEEERKNSKHSLEQIQPYLDARIGSDMGLLDERLDISFLGTLEFEGLIHRQHGRLTRIYGLTDDTSSSDLKMLHNSIERILRLTKPN